MKKLLLLLLLSPAFSFQLQATHIVGGEMNYTCLGNDQYEITLTVFRDCFNGDPAAFFDDPASIGVFSATNNLLLFNELVPFDPMLNDTLDPVLSGACLVAPPEVCVHTTTYTTIIELPPLSGGYILSYQRCCRNQTISNIVNPLSTGATYSVFISETALQECNSNAKFDTWPPIYICVNEPISFDHSATDIDGDSIVYKLCTPFTGASTFDPQPIPPNPPPYQEITWIDPPYNESNMLNGSPGGEPLTIDPETGLLEGLPNTVGQFVVGVCAEEYRDGVLISTTRRDFQYNVGVCGVTTAAFTWPDLNCNDLSVDFINESINAESFIWDFGDPANPGPNSTAENPSYTYPQPGVYTVTLIVEPNTVCSDTVSLEVDLQINNLEATDLKVCSGEAFDLEFTYSGDSPPKGVTWSDLFGNVLNPEDVIIDHADCAPGIFEYVVAAPCPNDPTVILSDTAQITVITDDLTPYFNVVEEPCFVDVTLDAACTDYLQILGDIPVVMPGDSGSVTVEILQTTKMTCTQETVTLNYNCACSIGDLVIEPGECMDGFFLVDLDFSFENTTGEFQVTDQDNNDLGTFSYDDLPVTVGPFLGDPSLMYALTVTDLGLPACSATLAFDPVECIVACNAGTEGPICEEGVLQLFEDGGDAVGWEWFSDGDAIIDDVSAQNPTATNVANGEEFSVVVFGVSGLADTCTTIATVLASPVCMIEADSAICAGSSLPLTETGGEAVSWTWSSDGNAVFDDAGAQSPVATEVTNGEVFTVEITDANGCTSSCSFTAVVFDLPVCLAETAGPICEGDNLQLAETGGEAISWSWSSDGDAVLSDPTGSSPVAENVSDGETFTVEITDANGCVSSCSVTAVVNDLPVCEAMNDGPVCAGDLLGLSEEGGDGVSWQWSSDGDAVFDDPTLQSPTVENVSDGEIFTVTVTDANGCTSTCSTTAEVLALPVCNASNDGPVCAGDALGLSETGGDGVSWQWSSDGDAVFDDPTLQSPTVENVSDGEIFTVTVTDANGCTSTCSTTAEVLALPVCSASNDGPVCAGDPLTLFEDGGDAVSWQWSSDGAAVISLPTDQNPIATDVADGETFTVAVTDANGCVSSCTTVAEIYDSPNLQALNNGPICESDILILEADIEGGTAPFTYQWSHANGFSSNNETVYIQMTTQADAGLYDLVVTDANGCTAQATTEVVITPGLTDPGEIAGDEYFCGPGYDPAPIQEVSPPSGAPGTIVIFWMQREEGGDWEIIPGATGATYDPGPIYVTTEYTRCVQLDGCLLVLETNVVTKVVGDEVAADISGPASICLGEEGFYFVSPTPGATYSWDFGPNATAPDPDDYWATPTFNSLGIQTISITVSTPACTATNFFEVFVTNSPTVCDGTGAGLRPDLRKSPAAGSWRVFPNPFSDVVTIRIEEELTASGILTLSDMHGRLLRVVALQAGQNYWQMNLEEIPSGLYIILLEQAGETVFQEKVVKR